jgi:hypothetical protein
MRKTSVYLTDEEAEALRRAAKASGRSQSDLIREGVWRAIDLANGHERVFHSMGIGRGDGTQVDGWDADELYRKVMGLDD